MALPETSVGTTLERELRRFDDLISECQMEGVEDHVIQRFAARLLQKLKRVNILVAVDHAIFKKENGFINVLEAEMAQDLNDSEGLSRKEVKRRMDHLLRTVVSRSLYEQLDDTMDGNAWTWPTQSEQSMSINPSESK